jgi:hypothetical protein
MNQRVDVELVLRDVLEVLRHHNIPVETASLNVSLREEAFDQQFPQLADYTAGNLYRTLVIETVPVVFQAQRRYPFDDIVRRLEHEIRPGIETFAAALQQEYPDLSIAFDRQVPAPAEDGSQSVYLHQYRLGMSCQFSDDAHTDYNELDLAIFLQQRDATTYPHLWGWVGWLVEEESGGDWGVEIVYQSTLRELDYAPYLVDLLHRALPSYVNHFRKELVRKLSGELSQEH